MGLSGQRHGVQADRATRAGTLLQPARLAPAGGAWAAAVAGRRLDACNMSRCSARSCTRPLPAHHHSTISDVTPGTGLWITCAVMYAPGVGGGWAGEEAMCVSVRGGQSRSKSQATTQNAVQIQLVLLERPAAQKGGLTTQKGGLCEVHGVVDRGAQVAVVPVGRPGDGQQVLGDLG